MRAIRLVWAALVCCVLGPTSGFFGYDAYHDARSNYYEFITNCEREGGSCINVDFGLYDQPPDPMPAPRPTLPPYNPPTKVVHVYVPMWPYTSTPRPTTRPRTPRPTTRTHTPRPTTRAHTPRPTTRKYTPRPTTTTQRPRTKAPRPTATAGPPTPRPTTRLSIQTTKPPIPATPTPSPVNAPQPPARKVPRRKGKARKAARRKGKGKRGRRRDPEFEGVERRRRAIWGPDPYDYLYSECTGGWEMDLGCSAKGYNICCLSSGF